MSERMRPDKDKFHFIPKPETLKLMALNRALETGDDELIHEVQAFIEEIEIVPNGPEIGDLDPNQITTDFFIKRFNLPERYLEPKD